MIAISYRRQDSSPVAGRLYDRLQAEFGKGSVFMDFDSIPYGVDFREHIKQTLRRAKVIVAIIGPQWCGGKDVATRRIDDPTDFVRLEVATALESGIPIIPVLVDNTPMPEARNLPPDLEGLAFRNGLALDTGIDFHHHTDRLIAGIHRVIDPPKEAAPAATARPAAVTPAPVKKSFPVFAVSAILLALAIGSVATWYFLSRAPSERLVRQPATVETTPEPKASSARLIRPEPTAPSQPIAQSTPAPSNPPATSPTESDAVSGNEETGREHTFSGKVGAKEATFRLRFEQGGHVIGTYTQGGSTYRLEGRHPRGKMLLDEYTGERVTAHIDLSFVESPTVVRWEGTMHNTPPDNRVLPVWFTRPRR
jgi:hypothetical protein